MIPDALAEVMDSVRPHIKTKRDVSEVGVERIALINCALQALNLAKTLMGSTDFSDASTLDSSKLSSLGTSLSGFPPSYTKDISASALSGAMDALKECDFPRGQVIS